CAERHQATTELELGDRERGDAPVAASSFGEQVLGLGDLSALGLEYGERTQRREVRPAPGCVPAQHEGLGGAPDRLENRRPLRVHLATVRAALPRSVEVTARLGEAVEDGPRPGPG